MTNKNEPNKDTWMQYEDWEYVPEKVHFIEKVVYVFLAVVFSPLIIYIIIKQDLICYKLKLKNWKGFKK